MVCQGRGSGGSNNNNNRSGRSHGGGDRSYRGNNRSTNNNNNNKSDVEIKFAPHHSRKQQTMTCDSVKDHVIHHMQKTLRNGADVVKSLRENIELDKNDIGDGVPTRKTATVPTKGELTDAMRIKFQFEQDGCNIECETALREHDARWNTCVENQV